ncbi:glycosyltransferase [Pistricoccus aurantiacus]|uniref:glycosyltransferase n=1 Tax=Pistricoccus aurantiacus TaxID=1883414 RepID=UPI00364452E5
MAKHIGVIAPALPSHFSALQALACELIERGHRVTFLHQPEASRWLSDSRIGFQPLGESSHPPGSLDETLRLAANPGGPLGLKRLIQDMSRTTEMLCREVPRAIETLQIDALLCDQMEAAGGLVGEAMGLPYISVACALPINREPGLPLPVMPMSYQDDPRRQRIYAGSERVYDDLMKPHRRVVARHAAAFGLSPRDGLHECLSPYAQISQTVSGFDFPRRALPKNFYHVGPLRAAPTEEPDLDIPIAQDRPLVFASLGTLQGHRFGVFRRIARACRRIEVQLLLAHCGGLNSNQEQVLEREGATWVRDFVPQRAALARANAVVSHGGLNTVMDALLAHTPILVLPLAFDQPGVAARVVHAGVGLKASARFSNQRALSDKLETLLTYSRFAHPLERLSDEVKAAGGAPRAATIVEKVIDGDPAISPHASAHESLA